MYDKWMKLKKEIGELSERLHEIEADIYIKATELGQVNPQGSKTYEDNGFKVTITSRETVKVDQGIAALNPELFNMKFDFSKTMYKTLTPTERAVCDEAITITPGKPGFSVSRITNGVE